MLVNFIFFTFSLFIPFEPNAPSSTNENTEPIYLLHPGQFHGDEVVENAEKMEWYGLFVNEKGSYIEKTKIESEAVFDVILDTDSLVKSGKLITIKNNDQCITLISGLKLKEGYVTSVKFEKYYLNPGESMEFNMHNKNYVLEASGIKSDTAFQEWRDITDYKLIFRVKEDALKNQLLMSESYLNGNIAGFIWIGDLDNDKKPDLIMNLSNHYNRGNTTLLLSDKSEKNDLVKKIAELNTTGC